MNAAARALEQGSLFHGNVFRLALGKRFTLVACLIACVLLSAISVIYVKNNYRYYFSQTQYLRQQSQQLNLEWRQLLLEQNTWASPTRVERIASQQLAMNVPAKSVLVTLS